MAKMFFLVLAIHRKMHSIIQSICHFIRAHFRALYSDLDAAHKESSGFHAHNPHYLASFIIYLFTYLYGTFGLIWGQDPDAMRSWTTIRASSHSHARSA